MDAMDEIRQTFFEECEEQLGELDAGLRSIEAGTHDVETLNTVFRAVHSVKGGAASFALSDLTQFALTFESLLDGLRVGRFVVDPDLLVIMRRAAGLLAELVLFSRAATPFDLDRSKAMIAELTAANRERSGPTDAEGEEEGGADFDFEFEPVMVDLSDFDDLLSSASPPDYHRIRFRPRAELYANGNEAAILLREVERLGTLDVTCDISDLPRFDDLDPEGAYFAWTADLHGCDSAAAISDIFDFVEWDSEITVEEMRNPPSGDGRPDPNPSKRDLAAPAACG